MTEKIMIERHQLEKIYLLMNSIKDQKYDPKFSYFIIRNIKFLQEEFTSIYELRNSTVPTADIIEFNRKRDELINLYAVRDYNGNVQTISYHENGQRKYKPYFGEKTKAYEEAESKLKDEYYNSIVEYDKNKADVADLLSEKIETNVFKISYKYIPRNLFTVEELYFLSPMFKESEEELDNLFSTDGDDYVTV